MNRKKIRIAYFTTDANRELVSASLYAAREFVREHEDVYIQVFDCLPYALYSDTDISKYVIYKLPDLSSYDAILVQSHQIIHTDELKRLAEKVRQSGIPAISVGAELEGFCYIGTDDYKASRELTEHLIRAHGAGSFFYLKGVERGYGRGEAERRREGFEDACREHGIAGEKITYSYAGWENEKARRAVTELLESGSPLPDAVVAANDEMALGAMRALTDAGYSVPDDIIVAGFDDIQSAMISDPRLTTVSRDFRTVIGTALNTLVEMVRKEPYKKVTYSPHRLICSESCGCSENAVWELPRIRKMFYSHFRELEHYNYLQDSLTADLFTSNGVGILDTMEKQSAILGDGRLYIFLRDSYFDWYKEDEAPEKEDDPFREAFVLAAYNGDALSCGRDHVYMRITRNELPDAAAVGDEHLIVFYPVQYANKTLGFLGMTTPPSVAEMQLHENIINLFAIALENSRQQERSRLLNNTLNQLYMTDPLTGLYNRFGYEKLAKKLYDDINARGSEVHVIFIDMDDLKEINDRYGHEYGDMAIEAVSNVIKESCRSTDFKMRYGGDEFVIISESGQADLKGRLYDNIEKFNRTGKLGFAIHVSIGDYSVGNGVEDTLENMLRIADELMYQEKQERKSKNKG